MNAAIREYIEKNILPCYDVFEDGHDRSHVDMVIRESLYLADKYGADADMCYVIAAYHDLGIPQGRKTHHLTSAAILASDMTLRDWFDEDELLIMKEAVEDHRASSEVGPRSLYGCIIADADHFVVPEDIIGRIIRYGYVNYPGISIEQQLARAREHLQDKYLQNGYLHFYLNDPRSLAGLEELRRLAADEEWLKNVCDRYI